MAVSVNGKKYSSDELAKRAKVMWKQKAFVRDLIREQALEQYAAKKGLDVTDDELQKKADAFRMNYGLYDAADTEEWMASDGLTVDDFETMIRQKALFEKMVSSWPGDAVGKYFAENRSILDTADIYMLVVDDEATASELKAQVDEEGSDFMALAREYSKHPTGKSGGYVGWVRRSGLSDEVAAAVFSSSAGQVLGPFNTSEGYTLIHVADLKAAALNPETEQGIKLLLSEQWLQDQIRKADVKWNI